MEYNGFLPIGSVVSLGDSSKRLMIIGLAQATADDKLYDYAGVAFPEGYAGMNDTFLFNSEQIGMLYSLGYQTEEWFKFKEEIEEVYDSIPLSDEQ